MELDKAKENGQKQEGDEMIHQEKMIKTGKYSKHKPIMLIKKDKQFFDSADHNIREDHDRKKNQEIQEVYYEQFKKLQKSGFDKSKKPLIKSDPKTGFDSAEYFMNKEQEEKHKHETEQRKVHLEKVNENEGSQDGSQ